MKDTLENFLFRTHDIAIAAYLMMKNLELSDAYINATGTYVFEFSDPEKKAEQLSIAFLNSESSRFDNQMRNLRKILKVRN
tara:strand:- start:2045 stop:2287 length:243 start_codon:yes stop_codon:yes gene_type:complete